MSPSSKSKAKNNDPKQQRVAIIGAGVAGCGMAGALIDYNITNFTVFEKNSKPGGLWADNYPNASVQSTFELYEYPCKKYPPHIRNRKDPPAPTASEVCEYLEEYIDSKNMRSKFQFHTKVASVYPYTDDTQNPKSKNHQWVIEFEDFCTEIFDFVIVCSGLVSVKPKFIDFVGKSRFLANGGKIYHSSQRKSNDIFLNNKKVMVIGNGKSAVDAATAASEIAKLHASNSEPPIQLARRQTWYVPRYIFGCIQYKWLFHTRLGSSLLLHPYYEINPMLKTLHWLLFPFKWILWRILELLLLCQYRLPKRLWPNLGTLDRAPLENSVLITDNDHLERLRNGDIDMRIGEIDHVEKDGRTIVCKDGSRHQDIDIMIQATGWQLAFDLMIDLNRDNLFGELAGALDFNDDGLWLYRNVLPAEAKGIAFVGSNTLTFMNIFTSYIQSYWLAELLAGDRPWPTRSYMKASVEREKNFKRNLYHMSNMRGASIEGYMQHYHDVMFDEMNARKPFNCVVRPIANMVVPVVPALMEGCLEPVDTSLLLAAAAADDDEEASSSKEASTKMTTGSTKTMKKAAEQQSNKNRTSSSSARQDTTRDFESTLLVETSKTEDSDSTGRNRREESTAMTVESKIGSDSDHQDESGDGGDDVLDVETGKKVQKVSTLPPPPPATISTATRQGEDSSKVDDDDKDDDVDPTTSFLYKRRQRIQGIIQSLGYTYECPSSSCDDNNNNQYAKRRVAAKKAKKTSLVVAASSSKNNNKSSSSFSSTAAFRVDMSGETVQSFGSRSDDDDSL